MSIRYVDEGGVLPYPKKDGAIATIMALDRAIRCGDDTSESVYDRRGLLVF